MAVRGILDVGDKEREEGRVERKKTMRELLSRSGGK